MVPLLSFMILLLGLIWRPSSLCSAIQLLGFLHNLVLEGVAEFVVPVFRPSPKLPPRIGEVNYC
jgi:hypothetical protein